MLILSAADVRRAVPMPAAINAVAAAFAQLSSGAATVPIRLDVAQPSRESHTFVMPAHLAESNALGLKVVSVFPHNAGQNSATIHALVVMLDAETGRPIAAMDGTYLTALRTGAAWAQPRARSHEPDAKVLAVFGAGAQAPTQIQAVCAVRPIERVWIVNRNRERAEALIERLRAEGLEAELRIGQAAEALTEADVVCCATTASTPIFADALIRPGTHINGVGSFTKHMAEVPIETIKRAQVFVDQREAAWAEAGDLVQAREAGALNESQITELGAVLAGQAAGRTTAEQITFFKSVGNAVQDVAVAQLALGEATRLGLGTEV